MSVHVAIQLAKSYIHAAQFKQAEKIFLSAPFSVNTGCVMNVIKGQQYRSAIFLLQGDSIRAAEAAETALSLCEAQDNKDIDITVHTVSYGLKGELSVFSFFPTSQYLGA